MVQKLNNYLFFLCGTLAGVCYEGSTSTSPMVGERSSNVMTSRDI